MLMDACPMHSRKGPSLHNIAKRARWVKSSRFAAERSTLRAAQPTLAAEVAKVRGGAANDTTGDHCSDTILYPMRFEHLFNM